MVSVDGLQSKLDGAIHTDAFTPAVVEIMHASVAPHSDTHTAEVDSGTNLANGNAPAVVDITDAADLDANSSNIERVGTTDESMESVSEVEEPSTTTTNETTASVGRDRSRFATSGKTSKLKMQLEECIGTKNSTDSTKYAIKDMIDVNHHSQDMRRYRKNYNSTHTTTTGGDLLKDSNGGLSGGVCVPVSSKDEEDWDAESRDLFQLSNMKQRLAIHADEMFLSVRKEHQEEITTLLTHLNKEKVKRKDAVAVAETLISENRSLRETHQLELLRITQMYEEKFQAEVDERVAKQMKCVVENQKTAHQELESLLKRERRENSRQAEVISKLQSSRVTDVAVAISNTQSAMEKDAKKHLEEIERVSALEVEAMKAQCEILQGQLQEQSKHHQTDMETLRFNSEVISQQWTSQAAEAIKGQDSHIEKVHELVNETVGQLHTIEAEAIQQRDNTIDSLVKQVKSESSFTNMVKHLILALFLAVAVGTYFKNASEVVKCQAKDQELYQCQAQVSSHIETLSYLQQHCEAEGNIYKDRLATAQQNITLLLRKKDMQCDEKLQQVAPHERQLVAMTSNYKRTLSSMSKKCSMWSTHATDELRSSAAAAANAGGTFVWNLLGFPSGSTSCDHSMCSRLLRGGHAICEELYEQHIALVE